jgi:hypothetical protein
VRVAELRSAAEKGFEIAFPTLTRWAKGCSATPLARLGFQRELHAMGASAEHYLMVLRQAVECRVRCFSEADPSGLKALVMTKRLEGFSIGAPKGAPFQSGT